jgi:nitroimidazol reductase NimA-like FMN-containing flavoprotein (pyridoxamine 5'-phosphate oxidase superfamily)
MDVGDGGGALTELREDECWDLLSARTVGRVGWQGGDGPTIVPVNYVVDGRAVVLRTAPYTDLGREGTVQELAFEVDDIDPVTRSGWSVLVRGRRRLDPEAYGKTPRPEVWVGGSRWLVLRIEVRTISGRRLTSGG